MPLYLCRWENGDCSFVWAANKGEAIEALDEIANAEGFPIIALRDFMAHFRLTDTGELEFEGFGERTEDAVSDKGVIGSVGCVAASANTSPLVWTYQAQLNPTSAHFHDEVEEGRLHLLEPVGRALRHDDDVAFN